MPGLATLAASRPQAPRCPWRPATERRASNTPDSRLACDSSGEATAVCGRLAWFSCMCFMALESRLGSRLHRTCMKLTNSTYLASVASDCIIQLYKGRDLLLVGWTRLLRRCRRHPVNSTGQCNKLPTAIQQRVEALINAFSSLLAFCCALHS